LNLFVSLECGLCKKKLDVDKIWNLCPDCGKPLLAKYDLKGTGLEKIKSNLSEREPNLWRYHELLPVQDPESRLTLGEGFTPLFHAHRLGKQLGFNSLFIKDEGLNPTGSFKARGLCMAVSRAKELGIKDISIPSAGNAAGALCAYASLGGLSAHVFMPDDVPRPFIAECRALGGHVTLVDGLITDCGARAAEELKKFNRFDVSTLKEPYRIEGKKTMGYEIGEQMNWKLPDVIIYPTGGGTGLVGMWKAFGEMSEMGWIDSKRPRMVSVQSENCAPIVKAFQNKKEFAEPWPDASTIADGLRVPSAIGDFLILRALRESRGTAIAVSDEELLGGANTIGHTEGIFACPEGGATLAAFIRLREKGWINNDETVVLFNTASGHKYYHLWDK
jgi:threonine synthase